MITYRENADHRQCTQFCRDGKPSHLPVTRDKMKQQIQGN